MLCKRAAVHCNIGVEWFTASSISFLAEYGIDLYYLYSNSDGMRESYNMDGELTGEQESSASGHGLLLIPGCPARLTAYL